MIISHLTDDLTLRCLTTDLNLDVARAAQAELDRRTRPASDGEAFVELTGSLFTEEPDL